MDISSAHELLDLGRAVEAHLADDDSGVWVNRLNERVQEIEPAMYALENSGHPDDALDLAGALSVFWQDIGRVDEGRSMTESLLNRLSGHPGTRALARAHLALGELAFRQGDQEVATSASTTAQQIAAETGDDWVIARAELNLARVAFREGDAPRIFQHAERVLTAAGDNVRLRTGAIHMLGWAEYTAGNLHTAMERFEENVDLYRQSSNRIGEASELANLGDLSMEAGRLGQATDYLKKAFSVRGARENRYLMPSLIRSAGVLAVLQGRHALGLELIAASERQYEELGLIGDPGDELTPKLRQAAVQEMGMEAEAVEHRGRNHTFEQAAQLAAESLRP